MGTVEIRTVKEIEEEYQKLKNQMKREDINEGVKFFLKERIRTVEVILWLSHSKIIPELTLSEEAIKLLNQMN
jgi:hypothetical protein